MPLGLFDSGVGGLTVLKQVLRRHRNSSCLYLADTARVPYGNRKPSDIREIASEIAQWFRDKEVTTVLMGCNTTNSLAFDIIEREAGVPVISLIRSAASMVTKDRVGVLATKATVLSGAYKAQIELFGSKKIILEQSCPAFVPMIENGRLEMSELRRVATDYLKPLLEAKVEEVILGCSHYPLLEPLFRELLPVGIRIIDPAVGLARELDDLIGAPSATLNGNFSLASTRFCVTKSPMEFAARASDWLGKFPEVELVSLQQRACFF